MADNPIFRAADPHTILMDGLACIYPTSGSRSEFYVYHSSDLTGIRLTRAGQTIADSILCDFADID